MNQFNKEKFFSGTKFVITKHFTNGFTIWAYFIFVTYFFKDNYVIGTFRTSLWVDQIFWAFLIPIILQNGFDLTSKIKPLDPKLLKPTKEALFHGFVIGISSVLLFTSYAFFVSDVMLIIPGDHPETWTSNMEYHSFSYLMLIGNHLNSAVLILTDKWKQHQIDKKRISELPLRFLSSSNKAIIMSLSFVLALIAFVIYNWYLEPHFLVN